MFFLYRTVWIDKIRKDKAYAELSLAQRVIFCFQKANSGLLLDS